MLVIQAVLFDLDDTLILEVGVAERVFRAVCGIAADRCGLNAEALHRSVRERKPIFHRTPSCRDGGWSTTRRPG